MDTKLISAKCVRFATDRHYRKWIYAKYKLGKPISDDEYLKQMFLIRMGKPLDLEKPKTFNEKLQWLKLYDQKPEYTMMVDKYLVRRYVADKIGEEYLIPLLGVWDKANQIDFNLLPEQFVLKCNHNSGGLCICKDKKKFDIRLAKQKLNRSLKSNYYLRGREWPYKYVSRKIIAEKYMTDDSGYELKDYKVFNFYGTPKIILVCRGRFQPKGMTEDFYDVNWRHLSISRSSHPNAKDPIPCPDELKQLLQLSQVLSKSIPFLRTDFYIINHKVYFGELTFYPASGCERFVPEKWDHIFGDWLQLPNQKTIN